MFSAASLSRNEIHKGLRGQQDPRDIAKGCITVRQAVALYLKRITKLKCVNSEFKSVDINPTKEVPSIASMAPCRSHHGNHTRQEWIII